MWRLSVAVVAGTILGVTACSLAPTPAYACSAGPDFDPVASSVVIVEGRILGYEVAPGAALPGSEEARAGSAHVPAQFEMTVERILKGDVSDPTFEFVDAASLSHALDEQGRHQWWGSGGACGAFDSDPTGRYAILGFWQDLEGVLHSSIFQVFYIGDDADGKVYDIALQRMASWPGAAAVPALGSGPGAGETGSTQAITVAAVLAAIGATLLGLGILSRVRFRETA